jgi:hypothetical protein
MAQTVATLFSTAAAAAARTMAEKSTPMMRKKKDCMKNGTGGNAVKKSR